MDNKISRDQITYYLAKIANWYELGLLSKNEKQYLIEDVKQGKMLDVSIVKKVEREAEIKGLSSFLM